MVVNEKVDKVKEALEELKDAILTSSSCSASEAWGCVNKIEKIMQQVVSMVDEVEKSEGGEEEEEREKDEGQTEEKTEVSEGDDGTKTVTRTSVTSSSTPEFIPPPSDDVMSFLRRIM